jgi:hypothetical protein
MTFDHANLNGSQNFQPVPSDSELWSKGTGQSVKQPAKKTGKGGANGGNGGNGNGGNGNGGNGNGGNGGNGGGGNGGGPVGPVTTGPAVQATTP